MATIYVSENGVMLRKQGESLVAEKDGKELLEVELFRLDRLCLFGYVQFSTQLALELLESGVEVALFSWSGKYRGRITGPANGNVALRRAQYRMADDAERCAAFARDIVSRKIAGQLDVLVRYRKNHPETGLDEMIKALGAAADSVTDQPAESLLGIEGSAARDYFAGLTRCFPGAAGFSGRNRRPPRDPGNALLSFCYAMLTNEAVSALHAGGLDPDIGFFHTTEYNRPSLALDLVELFRPQADRFVLSLFNREQFKADDFTLDPDKGCRLEKKALRRFFKLYNDWIGERTDGDEPGNSLRGDIRGEAGAIAERITGRGE